MARRLERVGHANARCRAPCRRRPRRHRDAPRASAMSDDALPQPLDAEVKNLLTKGEHAAAAAALWAAGHPRRAGVIYEQIFEHKKALNAYEAGGDIVGAV